MQQAPEFLRGVKAPRTLMLLYHRVDDLEFDPQLLAVSLKNFDEQLSVLRNKYRVVNCSDLVSAGSGFDSPANTVIITFDDGYSDNLEHALPILQKHEVPTTFFITTGRVRKLTNFWWDALGSIIFGVANLPQSLELKLDVVTNWDLSDCSVVHTRAHTEQSHWNLISENDPTSRHKLYRACAHYLRGSSELERARVLDQLEQWSERGLSEASEQEVGKAFSLALACNALTDENIVELAQSPLIELGSHTVSHPVLSTLSLAEQRAELSDSKQYLEKLLGKNVSGFAYPYGTRADYTSDTVALTKELSFKFACTNIPEAIWPGTDRFQLPRLLVRDCDGDYFEEWLAAWFGESS